MPRLVHRLLETTLQKQLFIRSPLYSQGSEEKTAERVFDGWNAFKVNAAR